MNESQLWKKINNLQKTQKLWHFTRIESATVRGIPDVNCVIDGKEFWLELKSKVGKNYGLSNHQINWHLKRYQVGGFVFILLPCIKEKGFKLLRIVGLESYDQSYSQSYLQSYSKDRGSCDHNHITSNHNHITSNHIRNHNDHNITIHEYKPIFKLVNQSQDLLKLFQALTASIKK